jgi:hypothetical protein
MRLILTTIILIMLAQPVWAKGVFYCLTDNVVGVQKKAATQASLARFTVKFAPTEMKASSTYFWPSGITIPTTEYLNSYRTAAHGQKVAVLRRDADGVWSFSYSLTMEDSITAVLATCERF